MKLFNRYAVYIVPEEGSALARLGSSFIGRDCETGASVCRPPLSGITPKRLAAMTLEARKHGLHITLKAPFFLKSEASEDDLLSAVAQFTASRRSLTLPRLILSRFGSFFVLLPATDTPEAGAAAQRLHTLANEAVLTFDVFRAAAAREELLLKETRGLTLRQQQNLLQWGCPYVFDDHRPHLAITDRLRSTAESRHMEGLLTQYFAPALEEPLRINSICVCRQSINAENGTSPIRRHNQPQPPYKEPFTLVRRFPLQKEEASAASPE